MRLKITTLTVIRLSVWAVMYEENSRGKIQIMQLKSKSNMSLLFEDKLMPKKTAF